jgi:hypothetical protein
MSKTNKQRERKMKDKHEDILSKILPCSKGYKVLEIINNRVTYIKEVEE